MPRPSSPATPQARFEALAFSIGEVIGRALVPALAAALRARSAQQPSRASKPAAAAARPAVSARAKAPRPKARAKRQPSLAAAAQPVSPVRPFIRRARDAQAASLRPRPRVSLDAFKPGAVVEFRQGLYEARGSIIAVDEAAGLLVIFDLKRKMSIRLAPSKVTVVEDAQPQVRVRTASPAELLSEAAIEPSAEPPPEPEPLPASAAAAPDAEPASDAPTAPAV